MPCLGSVKCQYSVSALRKSAFFSQFSYIQVVLKFQEFQLWFGASYPRVPVVVQE